MKKALSILFICLCMALCLIPSVGMLFFPTTETTENKAMAEAPRLITEEGSANKAFFQDFESWFNEHVALRNQMVYADAMVQTKLFQESNVSGVIAGTDGWLYYASTLSDFLGTDVLSERELFNLANNFCVVQDYVEDRDMDFVLTIAPNKNTLYGENMPYYKSHIVNVNHSAKLLAPYLEDQKVTYLDLFRLFREQDEVLYLKRDSHWNMKGACLAYNGIMDALKLPHEDYATLQPKLVTNDNGDLNKMLYSFYGELEDNYDYGLSQDYTYEKEGATVEDGWIVTHNPDGEGTLLMFRDSFANTLIPFLSGQFQTACYSKGEPNALERFVETYDPDCVVIEKVERNITNYLDTPPILTAPAAKLPDNLILAQTDSTVLAEDCMNDYNYYFFSGSVDPERMEPDSQILVAVDGNVHRAYLQGDNGFCLYLKKADFVSTAANVQVYVQSAGRCTQVLNTTTELPQ